MIPNLLLIGLVSGLLTRRTQFWLPIAMGLLWAAVIAIDVASDPGTIALAAALGAANTLIGLLVGRAFRGAERLVRRAVRA